MRSWNKPISHKYIFRILPIFRMIFSDVISQITFHTFAIHISQITIARITTLLYAMVNVYVLMFLMFTFYPCIFNEYH